MTRRELSLAMLAGSALTSAQGTPVERQRRQTIRDALAALKAERDQIGKGDYRKWYDSLQEFRLALRAEMDRVEQQNVRYLPNDPNTKHLLFRAEGTPPMYSEAYAGGYLAPKQPDALAWIESLPSAAVVQATSRWLKKQAIDLIFVPVPKMSDIYMDRIVAKGVPPDRITGPHLRMAMANLLAKDVEVIDLLPALLKAREAVPEPLYLPADSHWSPAGRAVCVRALAERLNRYPIIQAAKKAAPMFTVATSKVHSHTSVLPLLSEEEKAAVEPFLHPEYDFISRLDGTPYGNFESGPVMLIGDSFSDMLGPQLAQAINAPVAMYPVPGGSVQPVKELLRNRDVLAKASVVVWVVNYAIYFLHDWTGLPEVIRKELPAAPAPKA